jgi:hypothetical protein
MEAPICATCPGECVRGLASFEINRSIGQYSIRISKFLTDLFEIRIFSELLSLLNSLVPFESILVYAGHRVEELDVTSRDVFLDVLKTDSEVLTRPTDLQRHWNRIERIELREGNLLWYLGKEKVVPQGIAFSGNLARRAIRIRQQAEHDGRGVLDEFVELAEGNDSKILEYARTWGVLELCQHGLPYMHGRPHEHFRLPPPDPAFRRRKPTSKCLPLGIERLAVWRFFSRQANALLRIAASLQQEKLGDSSDWALVLRDRVSPKGNVESHRDCWADVVDSWMTLGDVRPHIDLISHSITWARTDLFGELAVQLALVGVRADGQVHCTNCGRVYAPRKQIVRGGVHYCPDRRCQKVAGALRSARYRGSKGQSEREKKADRKLRFRGVFDGRTDDPLFS